MQGTNVKNAQGTPSADVEDCPECPGKCGVPRLRGSSNIQTIVWQRHNVTADLNDSYYLKLVFSKTIDIYLIESSGMFINNYIHDKYSITQYLNRFVPQFMQNSLMELAQMKYWHGCICIGTVVKGNITV